MSKKIKAIVLVSGGLDSVLATYIMKQQGVELVCLNFKSFFSNFKAQSSRKDFVKNTAEKLNVPLRTIFLGESFLELIVAPKYGYGKNINPCIDCRIYQLKKAKKIMAEENAKFIVTGEVLGQRPMSQNSKALKRIEKEAGLEGLLLRPLSANMLEPTVAEIKGWVSREELCAITGRSRKEQLKLTRKFNVSVEDYANPAGGCLLTDKEYSYKLRDLIECSNKLTLREVAFLNKGRHFRISKDFKVIVGRDKEENELLERMAGDSAVKLWAKKHTGPLCLGIGESSEENIDIMGRICGYYLKCDTNEDIEFVCNIGETQSSIYAEPYDDKKILEYKISCKT